MMLFHYYVHSHEQEPRWKHHSSVVVYRPLPGNRWLLRLHNSCCELTYTNISNYAIAWREFKESLDVFIAVILQVVTPWIVTTCSPSRGHKYFSRTLWFHLQSTSILKMEAVYFPETLASTLHSVTIQRTAITYSFWIPRNPIKGRTSNGFYNSFYFQQIITNLLSNNLVRSKLAFFSLEISMKGNISIYLRPIRSRSEVNIIMWNVDHMLGNDS
jgi:hypothetical protein